MKKFITLLLVLTGITQLSAQTTESGKVKLYFQNNNSWAKTYLYVKGNDGSSTELASWPGTDVTSQTIEVDGNTYHYLYVDLASLNSSTAVTVNFNNGTDEQSYDWENIKYDAFFSIATVASETSYGWTKYNLTRENKYYLYDTSSLSIKLDLVSGNVYGAIIDNSDGGSTKYYIVADTDDGAFNWGDSFDWSKSKWRPWNDDDKKNIGWATIALSSNNCWKGTGDGASWGFAPGKKYYFTINPIDADGANYKFGVEPYVTATLNVNGYGTFGTTAGNYVIPAKDTEDNDVKAYVAKSASSSVVSMEKLAADTEVNEVEGLFLIGTANKTVKFTPASGSPVAATNMLKRGLGENVKTETGSYYRYVFSGDAFKLLSTTGVTVPVGKAYLEYASSSPLANELTFSFDDGETTSIRVINTDDVTVKSDETFNVAGQRVANPTKGLYIVNGKKVMVK